MKIMNKPAYFYFTRKDDTTGIPLTHVLNPEFPVAFALSYSAGY